MTGSVFDNMTDIEIFRKALAALGRAGSLPEGSDGRVMARIVFDACMVELARREAGQIRAAIEEEAGRDENAAAC